MKRVFKTIFATGLLLSCNGYAQDIHFSQFSLTPLLLNPALTGGFNGDHRGFLNYKNQWQTLAPYRTYLFSYDAGLFKKQWKTNYLGAGFTAMSDKAGDAQLGTTQFNVSVADFVSLGKTQQVSGGIQMGYVQKSADYSKLKWSEQFNGQNYDPTLSSGETFNASFSYWDISAGAAWNFATGSSTLSSNDAYGANIGIAVYHINQPKQNFQEQGAEKLQQKIVVHGTGFIGINNTNGAILPSFVFFQQGPAQEINMGLMYRYLAKEESKYTNFIKWAAISAGGYYRAGDAIVPALLVDLGSLSVGISYDVNISKLKTASNARGGFEIAIRYINPNPYKSAKSGRSGNVRFL